MKKTDKIFKVALTLLFGICAYIFWAIPYRSALSYQEQFQLFLFGSEYLESHLCYPGGIISYISEFLVQFYNNYWIGALIVTLELTAMQQLVWKHTCRLTDALPTLRYILTFVPAVALWAYMGDINLMPTYTISVICALLAALPFAKITKQSSQILYGLIATPIFYWCVGASVYLLVALICVHVCAKPHKPFYKAIYSIMLIVYAVAITYISSIYVRYPISQLFIGIDYYRLLDTITPMQVVVMALTEAIVILSAFAGTMTHVKGLSSKYLALAVLALMIAGSVYGIRQSFDPYVYQLVDYDYLVRIKDWDKIIAKAEKDAPNTKHSVSALNLALGMNDALGTRAFEFFQNGAEGLIPTFARDANTSLMIAEIYYQLGLINTAQRMTFEAMEAITNFKKSSRCIKRLVETNMLRGDYEVAEKYLKLLDKTLMYKKWAERTRQLLNNPGTIDTHPVYGRMRQLMIAEDYLFSEPEIDKIIGQLYLKNNNNTLARQYLYMYPLLQNDLGKFIQYMQVIQQRQPQYNPPIPQQAAILLYANAGQEVPAALADGYMMQRFKDFANTLKREGKESASLNRFKNTVWYYLVIGSTNER